MENNRNFLITIALSVLILTLWQVFYMNPRVEKEREAARIEAQHVQSQKTTQPGASGEIPASPQGGVPGVPGAEGTAPQSREHAVASAQRVKIDTPSISGSINLAGARIDDVLLKDYHVTVEKNSPNIDLLNPSTLPNGYYAE